MELGGFEDYLKGLDMSEKTIRSYRITMIQYFGQYEEISAGNLKAFREKLLAKYRPRTVNSKICAVNSYLRFAQAEQWKLRAVRLQQKNYLENVISESDYEYFKTSLKENGDELWYFAVRFMGGTGVRVSELVQIKAEDVLQGHLDLYSKGGKIRRIYIPKSLREETIGWIERRGITSGFLFLNRYGKRLTGRGVAVQLKDRARRFGLDPAVVYPHSFRHRFAKNFLGRYKDIALLADLMGHESIESTRIYLRKSSNEQQEIVDRVVDW